MNIFWEAANESGGHYSIGGIVQFGAQFFGLRKKITDASGIFCTEGTGKAIIKAEIPYITNFHPEIRDYMVDPSMQLNWFMTQEARNAGWIWSGYYNGDNSYFIDSNL
jgi:hypothetical protein